MDAADIDDLVCPLCCEEIAASDKFFYPCPCGYQVCRFCWNNIRENHNRLCPACRREYDDESVQFTAAPQEEIARIISERKRRKAGNKRSGTATASSSFVDSGGAAADRSHLKDIKVTQRTLVYVTNLPPKYAVEETLASDPYFGQFGKIVKLSISRRPPIVGKDGRTGENQIGVHVTFARPDDAYRCIQFVDGATIESRTLHATYGQTKYCAVWLQHRPCATHNCMFLHEIVDGDAASPPPAVAKYPGSGPRLFGPKGRRLAAAGAAAGSSAFSGVALPERSNSAQSNSSVTSGGLYFGSRAAQFQNDDLRSNSEGPALPAAANWATRKPEAPRATGSPVPSFTDMARVASPTIVAASQDPTPAAAAAALQREREEKARLAVIRKQQERKAADAARRAREEAERKAAAAEAASAAMAAAAAAQGSSTPGKKRRANKKDASPAPTSNVGDEDVGSHFSESTAAGWVGDGDGESFDANGTVGSDELSMASDANHLDNVSGMTQATQPDTESDAEDEAEPEFDFAAAILTSIPTKLPVLTLDPTTAAATAPLRPIVPLDVTSSLGSFADNSSPAWILSSCRVILKALERNPPAPALPTAAGGGAPSPSLAPLTTYAGSLRPFETGDLMSDILDERAQVTAPQGPTAAAAPGPQRAMVGAPGFLPPGPPPSSTMPGVVGGRGSPLTSLPMLPPGMGPARMLPPPGTSSGPPPGLTGPVTGGDSGLGGAALYGGPDSSMSFITQRLTGAAPGLVKRPGTPGSAPPPGLEGLARTASPAPPGLPFSDPAIVSVRPTSANAAGRGPPPTTGDKTEAVLMQKLREALNSGSAGRGAAAPPPGFGLPLKPQARSQAAAGPPPPPPGIGAMATHQQAGLLLSPHMMRSDGIHPQPQLQSIRPAPDADDVVVVGRAATTASTVIAAAPSRPTSAAPAAGAVVHATPIGRPPSSGDRGGSRAKQPIYDAPGTATPDAAAATAGVPPAPTPAATATAAGSDDGSSGVRRRSRAGSVPSGDGRAATGDAGGGDGWRGHAAVTKGGSCGGSGGDGGKEVASANNKKQTQPVAAAAARSPSPVVADVVVEAPPPPPSPPVVVERIVSLGGTPVRVTPFEPPMVVDGTAPLVVPADNDHLPPPASSYLPPPDLAAQLLFAKYATDLPSTIARRISESDDPDAAAAAAAADGVLPPLPFAYAPLPGDGAPLASTSKLLGALGLDDLIRDMDHWSHRVLTEVAATATTPHRTNNPWTIMEMAEQITSFMHRGAHVLFGVVPPAAPATAEQTTTTPTSATPASAAKDRSEVELAAEMLDKLRADFGEFSTDQYDSAERSAHLLEELQEATKDVRRAELRLAALRKKNRKFALA